MVHNWKLSKEVCGNYRIMELTGGPGKPLLPLNPRGPGFPGPPGGPEEPAGPYNI